jgi:hypothetical protein
LIFSTAKYAGRRTGRDRRKKLGKKETYMAAENADTNPASVDQVDESADQPEETVAPQRAEDEQGEEDPRRRPPTPAAAAADEDDLDDLEDMELMLDEIENRIAPLA